MCKEHVSLNQAEQELDWERAAEAGDAAAQRNLGEMYNTGQGVRKNKGKAAEWYGKAAEQGEVPAQRFLGFVYYHGYGAEQDYEKAAAWYRKAASKENEYAKNALEGLK